MNRNNKSRSIRLAPTPEKQEINEKNLEAVDNFNFLG